MTRRRPKPDMKRLRRTLDYMGHCERYGKRKWLSRSLAREHLRRLIAAGDKRASALVSYKCEACDCWHVGHQRDRP